jgi:hypothetical protein
MGVPCISLRLFNYVECLKSKGEIVSDIIFVRLFETYVSSIKIQLLSLETCVEGTKLAKRDCNESTNKRLKCIVVELQASLVKIKVFLKYGEKI